LTEMCTEVRQKNIKPTERRRGDELSQKNERRLRDLENQKKDEVARQKTAARAAATDTGEKKKRKTHEKTREGISLSHPIGAETPAAPKQSSDPRKGKSNAAYQKPPKKKKPNIKKDARRPSGIRGMHGCSTRSREARGHLRKGERRGPRTGVGKRSGRGRRTKHHERRST